MALPSLVDIAIEDGNHFTVCGDIHGQVDCFYLRIYLLLVFFQTVYTVHLILVFRKLLVIKICYVVIIS